MAQKPNPAPEATGGGQRSRSQAAAVIVPTSQQSQGSFFDPLADRAARSGLSEWRIAQEEARSWAEFAWSRNSRALKQAKKVLRSGGFLLHVDPASGAEQRITTKEAGEGVPFLSVWVSGGLEITRIYDQGPSGMRPRGLGWQFGYHDPDEHWTEWRRSHVEGDR